MQGSTRSNRRYRLRSAGMEIRRQKGAREDRSREVWTLSHCIERHPVRTRPPRGDIAASRALVESWLGERMPTILSALTLPKTIVLRPNGFSQPDYDVIHKDPDGRERSVGRIFHGTSGTVGGATPWFWTVEHHQRRRRAAPHQGRCDTLDEAKAAWRRCWDSADVPIHWPPVDAPGRKMRISLRG